MRVFLALDPPDPVRDALERMQEGLPIGRPLPPETLHLTLVFLDDQPQAALLALDEALQGLARPQLRLRLTGPGVLARERVVAAGVAPDPGLVALHARLRSLCHGAGITLPRTRFRPHVTIARLPPRMAPEAEAALARWLAARAGFGAPDWAVDAVTLFRSTLRPEGAVHQALATYPPPEGEETG